MIGEWYKGVCFVVNETKQGTIYFLLVHTRTQFGQVWEVSFSVLALIPIGQTLSLISRETHFSGWNTS